MELTTALVMLCACSPGEFLLRNCTDTGQPKICWPCSEGMECPNSTTQIPCVSGVSWSAASSTACTQCTPGFCPDGQVLVRGCIPTSDRVCTRCPDSFGCVNGTMERCGEGTRSSDGVCVPSNTTIVCGAGQILVGGACRSCPSGYSCIGGAIQLCGQDTYSLNGTCVPCSANSRSLPGSTSLDDCVCDPGYSRVGRECSACAAGTFWVDGACALCPLGQYCVGKLHHELCPLDMYSGIGEALCTECKPFSTCTPRPTAPCSSPSNCTCDPGYIEDSGSSCVRCPPGTAKAGARCDPCNPGLECRGGADVAICSIATYSPGNLSRCFPCLRCPELTRSRCNATHDSVCESAVGPLAVITVYQEFKTRVDGDIFGMFIMVYATSLPKAQLLRVCNAQDVCIQCFQGSCPVSSFRSLSGPEYHTAIEIRSDASRLQQNLEALTHTAFLMEAAKHAMRKVTPVPFVAFSRVEHAIICPGGKGKWNGAECATVDTSAASSRTWMGLLMCLMAVTACSLIGARRSGWEQVES